MKQGRKYILMMIICFLASFAGTGLSFVMKNGIGQESVQVESAILLGGRPEVIFRETPLGKAQGRPIQMEERYEYAYGLLSDPQKRLYEKMKQTIEENAARDFPLISWGDVSFHCSASVTVDHSQGLDGGEASEVFWALCNDHPEAFFLDMLYYYMDDKEMVMYLSSPSEFASAGVRQEIYAGLCRASEVYNAGTAGKTDAEKVRYLAESLCEWYDYAEEGDIPVVDAVTSTAASYMDRRAICSGYSKAFQFFCERMGVGCVLINGWVSEGYHSWDYVWIKDERADLTGWYAVDVTFHDCGVDSVLKGRENFEDHIPGQSGWYGDGYIYGYAVYPSLQEKDYEKAAMGSGGTGGEEKPKDPEDGAGQPAPEEPGNTDTPGESQEDESGSGNGNPPEETDDGQNESTEEPETGTPGGVPSEPETPETPPSEPGIVQPAPVSPQPPAPGKTPQEMSDELCKKAQAASDKGDYQQAIAYYVEALSYVNDAATNYNIAWTYHMILQDYEHAMPYYLDAIRMGDDNIGYGMAKNAMDEWSCTSSSPAKDWDKKYYYYNQMADLKPDANVFYRLAAISNEHYGDRDQAVWYINKALEMEPDEYGYQWYLGKLTGNTQ